MLQDFLFALRVSWTNRGLAAAIMLSVALAIGANTAIFSIVKATVLGELAVNAPDRLMSVHDRAGTAQISYPDYLDYSNQVQAFEGIAASYPIVPASFGGGGDPQHLWGQLVSTNYFTVVGAQPRMGRGFLDSENKSDVVVMADGLWRRSFNSDPSVVGRTVLLSGASYTIVGVAPPGFHGTMRGLHPDFWIPLGLYAKVIPLLARDGSPEDKRDYRWLSLDARLKPGISKAEAEAELRVVARRLDNTEGVKESESVRDVRLVQAGSLPLALGTTTLLLGILMAVVGLVLLVACANIANLLLARSVTRQKEIAIRLSVGASRTRLVQQLLVESVTLSVAGGILGVLLALVGTHVMARLQLSLPVSAALDVSIDWRVLLFSFSLSVITGILFGLVPALKSTKPQLVSMLKAENSGFPVFRRFGLKNALVVLQIALSLLLLITAGLFLRSLQSASSIPLGLNPDRVLLMAFDARSTGYSNERAVLFFSQLLDRVRAVPEVENASIVDTLPLSIMPHTVAVNLPGQQPIVSDIYGITSHYFDTIGVKLHSGRDFVANSSSGLHPAIVNETLASQLYGSEDPIEKTLLLEGSEREIIGVAGDTKSRTLGEATQPQLYLSLQDDYTLFWGLFGFELAVKTRATPASLMGTIRQQFRDLDPAMAVYNVETMRDHTNSALLIPRICGSLFGIFGAIGLALAIVGLYGLMNYSVSTRTKEIGIRFALGARPAQISGMVLRQALVLTLLAIVIGLALAFVVSQLFSTFLYGVSPHDAVTFVWVPVLLGTVAMFTSVLPAFRAARLNVIQCIRQE